ncbi:XdhC family protein [Pseudonocardia sp. RS11V-5]|uniref:XdhC family protein n=1 Tax=Pseudonocardia terrae TaxID=2905831 RepID=UPI001E3D0C48|nr:XdhC family protein [Pseudonocardia terrae]MCE3555424.1 XdhC family protein [Pseudonocardia terrae]
MTLSSDRELLGRADELRAGRTPYVLATVVRVERPASARPGDRALVLADGTIEGFVGGTCAESTTRVEGLRVLASGEPGLLWIRPGGAQLPAPPGVRTVDNPCLSGGAVELLLEPVLPAALVLVLGDAPVARALVRVGAAADHHVRVVTDPAAPLPPDTAAVVVASHGRDEPEVLTAALRARVPYVALVASRRRAAGVLAEVAARGVPAEDVARVHAPAGLDIGARTPAEIALAIYAQIVESRRSDAAPSAAGTPGPAHVVPSATDPVCGMTVAVVPAGISLEHEGAAVHFCGTGCRDAFLADPAGYGG